MWGAIRKAFLPETWTERALSVLVSVPIFVVVWQALDRALPVSVIERTLLTPIVEQGGAVRLRYHVKQHHEAEVLAYRRLYDGYGVIFDYEVRRIPPRTIEDGLEVYTTQIPVPRNAEPGKAKLVITACWERPFNLVHQIWPVCNTLKAIDFVIVRSD